jgi:hypothetical protein
MREFQRARESLQDATNRLGKKYGHNELLATVIDGYEKAMGIDYEPPAQESVKFITLAQAAEQFGIAADRIIRGITGGSLKNVGRFQHPAQPEISVLLVDQNEVQEAKDRLGVDEEVVETKLITLKQAAEEYNLPYGRVYSWFRSGYLPEKGREIFPTHGGGKILVDATDVRRMKSRPPMQGRPPIHPTE